MTVKIETTTRSSLICDACGRNGGYSTSSDPAEICASAQRFGWTVVDGEDRCPDCPDVRRAMPCSEFTCKKRRSLDEPRPNNWVVIKVGEQEREREYCSWSCVEEMIYCATEPDSCK